MDLGEILRVLRNRWRIMLPMMLLTGVLTALASMAVPTKYESHSTISLLSAERATVIATQGNTNPFLTFDSSLVATADFLSRSLTSNESKLELTQLGVTEEYTAGLATNAQGPFIEFRVIGTNAKHVLASTELLVEYASRKLREIQASTQVKSEDMVRLTQITPPQTPEPKTKDKLEIVIGAAGGGTVLAFALTFVVEGLSRSRRQVHQAPPQVVAIPARPRTEGMLDASVTVQLPAPDQTVVLPRVPVEFHEPAVSRGKTAPKIKGKAQAAKAQPLSEEIKNVVPKVDDSELLVLGPTGLAVPKPSNGSSWSTTYRSNGKAGPQHDADPTVRD